MPVVGWEGMTQWLAHATRHFEDAPFDTGVPGVTISLNCDVFDYNITLKVSFSACDVCFVIKDFMREFFSNCGTRIFHLMMILLLH